MLSPFPRAASALLDPSSKAAATKMEKVRFMTLPPSCVANSTEVFVGRFHVFSRRLLKLEQPVEIQCRIWL